LYLKTSAGFFTGKGSFTDIENQFYSAAGLAPDNRRLGQVMAGHITDVVESVGDEGDFYALERTLNKTLTLHPENPLALHNLGLLHAKQNRLCEAERWFNRALAHNPDMISTRMALARLFLIRKRFDQARHEYQEVLKRAPHYGEANNNLGWLIYEADKAPERALPFLERAYRSNPDDPHTLDSLAWVLYKLGNLDRARDLIRRAITLQPGQPSIKRHYDEIFANRPDDD
jgi:Flp pilus assembly protein TadD